MENGQFLKFAFSVKRFVALMLADFCNVGPRSGMAGSDRLPTISRHFSLPVTPP
jgi:hypothetical protein